MLNLCYESTKTCNLNCDYCITSDNEDARDDIDFEQIIEGITKLTPQRIVISGGEPLLDSKLLEKLILLRNRCKSAFISLSTNGAIEFDFLQLKSYIDCIDFSLPAIEGKLYKQMRGKNAVKLVQSNISKACDMGFKVRLSYVLTKVNSEELRKLLDYAATTKIYEFRIGRFFPFRDAIKYRQKYELTDLEIKNVIDNIDLNAYKFKIVPPISSLKLMEDGYITVNYLGEIFLPTKEGKVILGNILNIDPPEVKRFIEAQQLIFENIDTQRVEYIFDPLLKPVRTRASSVSRTSLEEFYSDRSRIIYSSSFRRLQQKAQVFSLESNSSVRSRLTHSIEVADIGKLLAAKIADRLMKHPEYCLRKEDASKIVSIVENACLMHDIGNPPFGHFGEQAIKTWWIDNKNKYLETYNSRATDQKVKGLWLKDKPYEKFLLDFEEFDGNPQGMRVVTRLHSDNDKQNEVLESGLNLSYPTLLSALKYVRAAGQTMDKNLNNDITKKVGFFNTETKIIEKMYFDMGISKGRRFPFAYIMEAADDIAYCMSDISDGIEKGIISIAEFIKEFQKIWLQSYMEDVPDIVLSSGIIKGVENGNLRDFNTCIASHWASMVSNEVVNDFIVNINGYITGTSGSIIAKEKNTLGVQILETIKKFSRKKLYRSPEAEEIEIAGYSIIMGLLEYFGKLLNLTFEEFSFLTDEDKSPVNKNIDLEWRIFNRISKRYVNSYKKQLIEWKDDYDSYGERNIEWWLRVHLIIDHISGMTDEFALKTYQVCKGIDIKLFTDGYWE